MIIIDFIRNEAKRKGELNEKRPSLDTAARLIDRRVSFFHWQFRCITRILTAVRGRHTFPGEQGRTGRDIYWRMATYSLDLGSGMITYELIHSRRKTLGITLYADGRVVVRAPLGVSAGVAADFLHSRAGWIERKRRLLAGYAPPPPAAYESGESHLYLGRPYTLRVFEATRQSVRLEDSTIVMLARDAGDVDRKRRLLTEWYRARAREVFAERLEACYVDAAAHQLPYPKMKIRLMKRRWGSCSPRGSILLNLRLVQAPLRCVDYVIFHELAHLKIPNHSKNYYALLDQMLPDWRERREELNRIGVR
jgi:predicted metal-dependent hydrolase